MLHLRTLGRLELRSADGRSIIPVLSQPRRLALLVYLAAARPRAPHQRDSLLPLFWAEADEASARHALSQALYWLREHLGEDVFEITNRDALELRGDAVACDVVAFDKAVAAGRWAEALELYGGDFLTGFHATEARPFNDWLEQERHRLRQQAARAAWALAREQADRGAIPEARASAWRAARLGPTAESSLREFLTALASAGCRADAVAFYEKWAGMLADELELEPAAKTVAVVEAVRRGEAEAELGLPQAEPAATKPAPEGAFEEAGIAEGVPDTPGPAFEPEPRRAWKTWLTAAAVAIAVGLVIWQLPGGPQPDSVADGGDAATANRVAVLPFTVRGNDELAWLEEGMAVLLTIALDGAGDLATVDHAAVFGFVEREVPGPLDPESGRPIAARFGAGRYIMGDILSVGGQIRAIASLYDGSGEPEATADTTVADETEVFDLVDEIARQLVVAVAATAGDELTSIGAATTRSLRAMKAFLRGEALLRSGLYSPDQARSVVAEYREAVEADSAFALPYFRMALVASTNPVDLGVDGVEAAGLAERFSDRLPPTQQYLVKCFAALMRAEGDTAEHWCQEALQRDPNSADAWFNLGEAIHHYGLRRGRETAEVRTAYERALALEPSHLRGLLLGHRQWIAKVEEDFESWAVYLARMAAAEPPHAQAPRWRLAAAASRGDEAALEQLIAELQAEPSPAMSWIGVMIMWPLDDRQATVQALRGMTTRDRAPDYRALGHVVIAHEELAAGRLVAAREELLQAQSLADSAVISKVYLLLSPYLPITAEELTGLRDELLGWNPVAANHRVWRFYLLGLLHDRLDDPSGAERFALELEGLAVAPAAEDDGVFSALAEDLALYLRGRIAARGSGYQEALSLLKETAPERWWPTMEPRAYMKQLYERWLTAEVLVALGRHEEALHWLAGFGMEGERSYMGVRHFRMAEIYEELGNREKARYHYGRFITYWRDADPELQPRVWAARRAMDALSTGRQTVGNQKS